MPDTFDQLGAQFAKLGAGTPGPQTEREIWDFLEAPASGNGNGRAAIPIPMSIGTSGDADAIGRWLNEKPKAPNLPANADLAIAPEDPLAPLSGPVAPLAFDPELENQTVSGGPFTDDPAAYLYAPLPEPNVEAVNAINELRATVFRSRVKASEPDRTAVREYRTEFEARREGKAGVITRAGHATSELFRGIANAPMRMFLTGLTSEILTEEVRFRIENGLFDGSEVVANKSTKALITSRHDVSEMRRRLKHDLMAGLPMLAPQNADKQAMLYTELVKIEPNVLPAARGVFEKIAQFGGDIVPFIAEVAVTRRLLRRIPGLRKMEPGRRPSPIEDPKRLLAGGPTTAPALDAVGRAMVTEAGAIGTVVGLHGGDPLKGAAFGAVLSGAGSAARGAQLLGKGPRAGNISQAVASGGVLAGHTRASGGDWTDTIIAGVVAPLLLFAGDLRRAPFRPATADPRFPDHVDGLRGHDTKVGRLIHAATRTKNNNPEGLTPEQVKQAAEILSELAEQSKPKISADEKLLLDHFRKYYAPSRVRARVKVVARAAATKRAEKPAGKPAVPAETKVAVVEPQAAPTQPSEPSAGVSRAPPTTSAPPPSIPRPEPSPVRKRDPNKPRYEVVPDGERWTVFDVDTGQTTAAVGSELIAQTIADEYNAAEAVTKGEPIKPPSTAAAPERPKPPARPRRKPGFLAAPKAAEVTEDALPDWEARIGSLSETERKAYERAYGPALNNPETMAGQVAQLSHQLSTAVRQEQRSDLIDTLKNQLAFLLHMQFKGEIPGATGVPTPVPEKKSEPPHIPPGVSPDVHREQELISGKPKKTFTEQRDADQQRNFIEEQYDAGKLPDAIASELGLKLGAVSDVIRNLVQRRKAQELRGELPSETAAAARKTQSFGQFVASQGHDLSELDASTPLYRQLKQDYDESQGNALPVGDRPEVSDPSISAEKGIPIPARTVEKPDPADRLATAAETIATALTGGEPNVGQQTSRAPEAPQAGEAGAQEQTQTDIEGEGVAVARGGEPAARGPAGDAGTGGPPEKPIPSDVAAAQASIAKKTALEVPLTAGKTPEFSQAVDFFREGTLGTDKKGRQTWTHPLRGGKKPVVLDEHKRAVMENAKFWFKNPDAPDYKPADKQAVEDVRKLVVELYGAAPPSQKPLKHGGGLPRVTAKKGVAGTFGPIAKGQRLPAKTVVDALFKAAFPSGRGQGQGSPWTENVLVTAADVTATDGRSVIVVDGDFAEDYAALAAKHPKEVRHLGGTGSKQAWKGSVFKETKQTATTRSSGIQVMNKNMLVAEDVKHFGDLRSLIEDYGGLTSRVEFPIQALRRGLFVVKPMFPVKDDKPQSIVVLVRNPDDSIGVYTANREVGIAEHNVHEGGELLLTINAEYLDAALRLMQQHGHDMAVMHYGGHDKPLKITTRDNSIQSLTQGVTSDDRGIWGSARTITKPGLYQLEVNDELQRAEDRHGYTYEAARAAGLRPAFLGAGSAEPIFTKGTTSGSLVTGLAPEHLQERGTVDERAARGLTFGFVDSEGRWFDAMDMDSAIRAVTPIAEIAKQAGASAGFDPGNPKQYEAFEVFMERLDRYGDVDWGNPLDAEKLERNLRRAYNRLGKAVGSRASGVPAMAPAPDKNDWPKPGRFEHRDWQRLRLKVADIQLDKMRAEGIAPQEPPGGPPRPTHAQAMQALQNAVTASARVEIEKQSSGAAEAHRALTKLVEKRSTKGISYFGAGPAPGADPTPVIYDRLASWIQNTPYGSRRQLLIDTLGRGFYGTYWRMPTDVWRPFERVKGAKKRAEAQAGTLAKRINAVVARRRLDSPERVEWWVYGMQHTDDKPAIQKFKDHGAAITALHRAQAEYRRAVRGFPDEAVSADFRRPHMDETVEATFHAELKQVVEGTMDPADLEPEGRAIYDAYAPMVTEGTDWLLNNKWTWQYLKRFGLNNIEEIIRARRDGPGVYLRRLYRRPLGVRPSRFEPDKAFDDRQIGPRIQGGMFKFRRGFDSGEVWTVRMADGTHNQFFDEGEAWEAWDAEIKANELEFGLSVFERVRLLDPLDATGLSLLEPIEDIRVLMAQTLVTQANNIATLKLFKFLADNFGTHSPAVGTVLLDGSPALGPLSDMYVPDHIARALAESIPIARNRVWMLWKAHHSAFKFSKVVYNPGTTGRNLLGLTWFLGLDKDRPSFQDVRDAVREMRDQGSYWRAMVEENEINVGWSRGEMDYFGTFMDTPGASPLRWAREVSEQIAARLPAKTRKVLAWASPKNVGRLYDLPDQIIKLASYMGKRRRHGYTHREAIDALWMYPNYDRLGKWTQKITRHPLGSPFLAFTDQAAKAHVRGMRDRKGPLLGMMALPGLMTALTMILIGIDDDEMEMINLAPQRRDWRGRYFQPVLPWRAPDGRPYTLDLRWTFPGASDFRVSTGSGGIALGTDLLFSDPIVTAIYGLQFNRDDWTGRDIIRDQYNSTLFGRFWKRATFVFRQVAPLPSIATRGFGRLYDAAVSGDAGRFIATMLKEVFGVSITKPFVRRSDAMRVIKEKLTKAEGAQAMGMLEIWNREFRRRTGPWADKPISPRAVIQSVRRQAIDKAKREALRK